MMPHEPTLNITTTQYPHNKIGCSLPSFTACICKHNYYVHTNFTCMHIHSCASRLDIIHAHCSHTRILIHTTPTHMYTHSYDPPHARTTRTSRLSEKCPLSMSFLLMTARSTLMPKAHSARVSLVAEPHEAALAVIEVQPPTPTSYLQHHHRGKSAEEGRNRSRC